MIVIVGAGLAGLSAAQRLVESGRSDFVVLEAKDRCGGRVQSIYDTDGTRLDLGAQWLHGEQENPLFKWLEANDLIQGLENEEIEFDGLFRTQSPNQPSQEDIHKILSLLIETKATLYRTSKYLDPQSCQPVEIFRRAVKDAIKQDQSLKRIDAKLIEATMRWFELHEAIDNSCERLSLLSLRAYSNWIDYDDGKMVRLKGGWQAVVNKLLEFIPTNKIALNSPVNRLVRSGAKVNVYYGDDNSTIECDHVLLTVSVGVLKDQLDCLLEPKLSAQLSQHISAIGYDVVDKIFLRFEKPFLQEERGLKFLWIEERQSYDNKQLPDWATSISGFEPVHNSPYHMLAWIGGTGAKLMEHESIDRIGKVCSELLSRFLPAETILPKVSSIHCTRWGKDPHIRGSYSYESVEFLKFVNRDIWATIYTPGNGNGPKPQILFAGEATAGDMYATAHGAIISGWREADRLLSFYSSDNRTN